jgi:hypothetical protein
VAKLADAQDLKSWDPKGSCGFDSHPRHHNEPGKDGIEVQLMDPTSYTSAIAQRLECATHVRWRGTFD